MTKLSKKKKIVLISVLSFVAALLITAAVLVGLIFKPANIPTRGELGFETVCYELPDDNDPTSHTGIENIGYMNWRLQHQNYWYSEAHVFVSNSMDNQNVSTYKQYNNGVLISTDISISNLVNKAVQYCQVRGGNVVLFRSSKGGKKTFNAINTPWYEGKPDGHTIEEYKVKKGLPPLEFAVYILNENTVKEYTDVIDNGDGTYSQTFTLNFESEPKENDATYWYKTEMAYKANGMMKEDPQFSEVTVTYTFDDTWQILSTRTREVYKTITGVAAVNCVAEGTTEYAYDNEELTYNAQFEQYYQNYMEDYEAPAEEVSIDAALCLSEAFGGVMQEETKLSLDLSLDGSNLSGIVQLNLNENDIRVDLGNVKVYLRTEDGEQYLYVAYGQNVKAKIALSDFSSATAKEAEDTAEEGGDNVLDNLLAALGDDECFTVAEDNRSATLAPTLDLGELLGIDLEIVLKLDFKFDISEDRAITLDYVKASGKVLGYDLQAELRFTEGGVADLTDAEAAAFTKIDVAGIVVLAKSEALKIALSYNGYGVEVEGEVTINLDDVQVKADLTVVLDGDSASAKEVSLIYANNAIYIALNSVNEQPVKIKVNVTEAAEMLSAIFGTTQSESEDTLQSLFGLLDNIGVGNLVNILLSEDGLSSVLALEGTDKAVITVDGTKLLDLFGVELELGEVVAQIENGTVSLSALGLDATVSGAEAFTFDSSEYDNATDILPIVQKILDIVEQSKLSLNGTLSIDLDGTAIELEINLLSIDWSEGVKVTLNSQLTAFGMTERLLVSYDGEVVKISLGDMGVTVNSSDIDEIISAVQDLMTAIGGNNSLELPELSFEDLDIFQIVNSLVISGEDGSIAKLALGDFEITFVDDTAVGGVIGISAAYKAEGVSVSLTGAHLTVYEDRDYPDEEVQYFDVKYALPLIKNVTEIIADKGVSVSSVITVSGIEVRIDSLALSWVDGLDIAAQVTLTVEDFTKTVFVEYNAEKIALYYDNLVVELAQDDLDEFIAAVQNLYAAIAAEVNGDEQVIPDTLDIDSIMSLLPDSGEEIDIFEILSSIELSKNDSGNLEVVYGDIRVELIVAKNGNLSANIAYGADLTASVTISQYRAVKLPQNSSKFDAAELIPLMENITAIIVNKGLTVSGVITVSGIEVRIDSLALSWADGLDIAAKITLTVEDFTKTVFVEYNAEKIALYYDNLVVELSQDDLGELIAAVQNLYAAIATEINSNGQFIPDTLDIDSIMALLPDSGEEIDIFEIINSIKLSKNYKGNLVIGYDDITVELISNGNLTANITYGEDLSASVTIAQYSEVELPQDCSRFDVAELIPLINNFARMVADKGVTLSSVITVSGIEVTIETLSISWANGLDVGAKLTLSVEDFEKTVFVEYNAEKIALYYDNLVVELAQDDLDEFIAAVQNLYAAIAAEVNADEQVIPDTLDIDSIMALLPDSNEEIDIFEILRSIELSQNEDGNLVITYGEISAEFVSNGYLAVHVRIGEDVLVSMAAVPYAELQLPENSSKFDAAELIPLMENITAIIVNKGLTVSGVITVSGIEVKIDALAISWADGLDVGAKLTLSVEDFEKTVFVEYNSDRIALYYDGIVVELSQDNLDEFIVAVQNLYAAIAAEVNADGQVIPDTLDIDSIMSLLPDSGDEIDIFEILRSIVLSKNDSGNLEVTYNDIWVELISNGDFTANIAYGEDLFASITISQYSAVELPQNNSKFDVAELIPLMENISAIIVNKGMTVSGVITASGIEVKIDALAISWADGLDIAAQITLTVEDFTKTVFVEYNSTKIALYYDSIVVELSQDDLDEFIVAVQNLYAAIAAEVNADGQVITDTLDIDSLMSLLPAGDEEIDVFEILSAIMFSQNENGNLVITYNDISVELISNGDLTVNIAYGEELTASVTISQYSAVELPQNNSKFDAAELIPLMENITAIIVNKGLTVSGFISVSGIEVKIDALAISWADGLDIVAQITLTVEDFTKTIYVEYNSEKIALYYDSIVVELSQDDLDEFIVAVQNLYAAIAAEVNADGQVIPDTLDIDSLMSLLPVEGEGAGLAILNSIAFTQSEEGNLVITYSDISVELISNGDLTVNIAYGEELTASVTISQYSAVEMPKDCSKLDVAELIPLIENVTKIIINKGVTVSGQIRLNGDTIVLTIYGLSVGWENGIELQLDARLEANGSVHDFYAEYSAGQLTIVYGALDSGAAIELNIEKDVQTLEDALVALFNRIAAVVNTVEDGLLPNIASLSDLLDLISTGKDAVSQSAELADILDKISVAQPSITEILASMEIKAENGIVTVDIGGITLTLWSAEGGFNLSVQTAGVSLEINNLQIVATEATDFNLRVEKALSAEDIADLLDYIGATAELFVEETFTIELSGQVTSTDEVYADKGGVKYDITAGFEYAQGESGFPVHIDREIPDLWIAPDMYVHVYANMISTIDEVDSVLFDIYIFDGNPTVDKNGKTTSAALTSGDNELDVYMSISRVPKSGTSLKHEPVRIYAPMDEIMTVLAAGLALVDVGSISIEALPELNDIITQIGAILDVMIVDRYFGDIKDQFTSLGSSLLESIIGGSISDLLNGLVNGVVDGMQPDDEPEETPDGEQIIALAEEAGEGFNRERFGLINFDLSREEGKSSFTVKVGETTATVEKQSNGERSRLTNLTVENSELNDTDTLEKISLDISCGGVTKATASDLAGYISIEGADALVKALVNSVTHEVPEEDRTEENPARYALNNSFFIDGTMGIAVSIGSFNLTDHVVYVDGLSVTFDENGEVEVNARLHYSGKRVLLTLVNGDSTVDLTVKHGMVYIKRVQTSDYKGGLLGTSYRTITPIIIYRAMPVDVFMADIMNQIFFMLNFSDTINGLVSSGGGNNNNGAEVKKDYGTQLAEYFNWFSYSQDAKKGTAQWKAEINGTGLSNLAGISISDITATFNAAKDTTGSYVVNSLGLDGALFSVLNFNASLDWQNPQEIWRNDSAIDTSANLAQTNPSINMEKWLGGSTFEEICKSIDWDSLPNTITVESTDDDGNTTRETYRYVELTFTGDATTPNGTVKFGTAEYYRKDGVTADAAEVLVESCAVLYMGSTLLSIVEAPDLSEYAVEHYTLTYQPTVFNNGTFKTVATYIPDIYTVKIVSERQFAGSVEGEQGFEFEYRHTYGNLLNFDFTEEHRTGETWYRIDCVEYNGNAYTAQNISDLVIGEDAVVTVRWKEIPHATVTVVSQYYIAGFDKIDDRYEKSFEIETGVDVNLAELVGEIAEFAGNVFGGFTLAEGDEQTSDIVNIDGNTTVYVKWIAPKISVIYYSALPIDGFSATTAEGYSSVYAMTATYDAETGFNVISASVNGYYALGWYYNDPASGWVRVSDLMNDIAGSDKYTETVELHAVWARATVEGSGTYTTRRAVIITYYTYTMKASISLEVFAKADLVSEVKLSSATFAFNVSGNPSGTSTQLNADGSMSVEGVKSTESTTKPTSITANVNVTFKIAVAGNVLAENFTTSKSGLSLTAA